MTRCTNTRCKWHTEAASTGCTLFGGKSWLDCKSKTVGQAAAVPEQTPPSKISPSPKKEPENE